ncbi:glycoprotein L [Rhinolophus gammaherpesvirus 1]|uniref:Glycoprotein L n=1 Tax=Rhinolophus gammaherpesvirus 1 TaxID=2054179 RepID=A0A2Z5U6C9_9GAMA|nr:glycoprotein L [Rhinolophus gammaherpesvirus 1]BBB06495.1 glycoprotein L [Rhinolophus gammaherpesvirus 1]
MNTLARVAGPFLCLLTVYTTFCVGNTPLPCCDVNVMDISTLPNIFEVTKMYVNNPITCKGVNVAKFQYRKTNSSVTTEICVNGFNLISFLLNVMQQIKYKTEPQLNLVKTLTEYRSQYVANFSVVNTNSSQFRLTTVSNGKVATTTRMVSKR